MNDSEKRGWLHSIRELLSGEAKPPVQSQRSAASVEVSFDADEELGEEWVSIDAIGFYGRSARSPDRRWLLAHGQLFDPDRASSSSVDQTGTVILFDGKTEACRLDGLVRPEVVAVCDLGTFVVYELGTQFLGNDCRLRVFSNTGECLFEHRAHAAIDKPALSRDGVLLAFHTLAAPRESTSPEDGESLFLFNVPDGLCLWQKPVPIVWPAGIRIDDAAELVIACDEAGETFRYSFDGQFLDEEAVHRSRHRRALENPRGYGLFDMASSMLKEIEDGIRDQGDRSEVEELLHAALGKEMSPNTKARARRMLGELAESRADTSLALKEFKAALELNPKIGLKTKVRVLEQEG